MDKRSANRIIIGHRQTLAVLALAALLYPAGGREQAARAAENPIHITFVIHFDPLFAPRGQVLRQSYEAERDNLEWLADFLERLEKEKGREFVPCLTLEIGGDHAEWYLEDEEGLNLLRRLYRKGIHAFGTHFHSNYKAGPHLWYDARRWAWSPQTRQRVTYDHILEVDRLIGRIIGSDDPKEIRRVNRTITGHLLDVGLAREMGFEVLTGGRNEAMNLFFDHDVYNPWRPAFGWPLSEDLNSPWVLIPQAPVLGRIGEHGPLPRGVPEEYTQGMRRMIWQDLSLPAMRRKFLHLYLEWREHQRQGIEKVWVFGWHEHPNDLYPPERARWKPSRREAVVQFVTWLNEHFIGRRTAEGRLMAKYANTDEVRDAFLAWEEDHPGHSSFNYPVQVQDWESYPYLLKGLARELMFAHHEEEIATFRERGVHLHRLLKTDARHWVRRGDRIVATAPPRERFLLWSDEGTVTLDFSPFVPGQVRVVQGREGGETFADARRLTVKEEPIVVEAADNSRAAGEEKDNRVLIQFRLNVNSFPDEAVARRNCRNLRRLLDLFQQAGVKPSFWFTGLATEQILRLDPDFIRLLNERNIPVGHHGANRPPKPMPIERVKGENWEEDVRAILDYESHALNPRTGKLDRRREGGLKWMQKVFQGRIRATGRFFQASILYATKQFGCEGMIGLKGNTGAPSNAAWFLGMKNLPDALGIGPEMMRRAAMGRLDLSQVIERGIASWSPEEVKTVAILIHDHDFLRGPPPLRERLWRVYESLVRWAAQHPRLQVVTYEEILDRIADDRAKTVSRVAVLRAAERVAAAQTAPPEYIDLGGDYLSLTDAFQAFVQSLRVFAETGRLPETVRVKDLLGPTEFAPSHLPSLMAAVRLPEMAGEEIVAAARRVGAAMADRLPAQVQVGDLSLNPAEFLWAMASTLTAIHKTGKPSSLFLHAVDALPASGRENRLADPLTQLQFWTYKPLRWR